MCFLWKYIKELLNKFSQPQNSNSQQGSDSQQGSSSQQGNSSQQGSSSQQGNSSQQGSTSQQGNSSQQGNTPRQGSSPQQGSGSQQSSGLNITPAGVKAVLDALKQASQGIASQAPENLSNSKGAAKALQGKLTSAVNAIAVELQKESNEQVTADETLSKIKGVEMSSSHKDRDLVVERVLTVTEADNQTYKNLMTADMLRYARALYHQLRDALQDVMEGDSRKGLLYGRKFVGSDAHRLDGKRFCNDKDPLDFPDMAICVLIDQSGSMHGIRMQSSKTAALLLHKVATDLGIPIMVCGHAARASVHFNVYADFEQQTDNDKYRICGISTGGRNRDGMAITIAAELLSKRPESNKLLFVISDGQPNDTDYGGEPAKNDIREIINAYRRKGVVTFGCAIGSDKEVVKDIYRKGFLDITELDAFPKLLCRLVVQNLDV